MKSFNWVLLITALVVIPGTIAAQAGNADLTGQIMDPSGAAVVAAQITATDVNTAVSTTTHSGTDGVYAFTALRPGTYRLSVVANGFSQFE